MFNKVMNKYEVVNEGSEDIFDPDSTGEDTPIDPMATPEKISGDLQAALDKSNIGETTGFEEDPDQIERTVDSELNTYEKDENAIEIQRLLASIKLNDRKISDFTKLRDKATDASDTEKNSKFTELLNIEIQTKAENEEQLQVLKPKKVKAAPKSDESEKPEEKEDKAEDKEDTEDKEDKAEDKEDKKTENESVEASGKVLTESKKPTGTEFYLTELN